MKTISLIMAIAMLMCVFAMTGCAEEHADGTADTKPTRPSISEPDVTEGTRKPPAALTPEIAILKTGKVNIPYTINVSNVRYVTSVDMLPTHDEFAQFDATFFEKYAVVVVTETVNSGSLEVAIESITVEKGVAQVKLSHRPGGALGSGVKTAWLLWAQVEQGLEYTWEVANPALESDASTT